MGPDLIKKPQIGNKDEPSRSPMQTRRQSRMFSIDFDCLDDTEDQDRIVKKYTQVGYETYADVLPFLILFEKKYYIVSHATTSVSCKIVRTLLWPNT